jgi:hypothetical protein
MSAPPRIDDSQRLVVDGRDRQRNVLQVFAAARRGDDNVREALAGLGDRLARIGGGRVGVASDLSEGPAWLQKRWRLPVR